MSNLSFTLKFFWRKAITKRASCTNSEARGGGGGGGGGGTPIYGLYRYVPRDRVWFLRFSVLK